MNKTEIFESYQDFVNRSDKSTNGVSKEFAIRYPNYAEMNQTNIGCWECHDCKNCKD